VNVDFSLSADAARFVGQVADFARARVLPQAEATDRTGEYPRQLVREAASLGLLGLTIPPEFGGAGRDYATAVAAIEEVAAASATLAVILAVHNSLVVEPLQEFGTPAQKDRWLRSLASGEAIGAFALTESQSGSDAADQRTVAAAVNGGYRLRGEKVWVTNGEAADVVIVFAATRPGERGRGITAFLVPVTADGLRRVPSPDSLGVRGLGCVDLTLDDVQVGENAVLGVRDAGFPLAKRALEGGRITIAAQALGVGRAALHEAIAYAQRREAFGHPISVFQAIQFQLADLATDLEAARALTWKAADAHDRAPQAGVEAAMAKLHASEAAHRAADRAMQILASEGYRRGSTIERLFRDIRAAEIYQGTSEVQRLIIARAVVEEQVSH
jgi:alkylation response protein AidB-like acyl-CoA dehydrogenase